MVRRVGILLVAVGLSVASIAMGDRVAPLRPQSTELEGAIQAAVGKLLVDAGTTGPDAGPTPKRP